MADPVRHSSASEAEVITDPELAAKVEGESGVRQFRAVLDMVESFLDPERPFKLRPSHLLHLHRVGLLGFLAPSG